MTYAFLKLQIVSIVSIDLFSVRSAEIDLEFSLNSIQISFQQLAVMPNSLTKFSCPWSGVIA